MLSVVSEVGKENQKKRAPSSAGEPRYNFFHGTYYVSVIWICKELGISKRLTSTKKCEDRRNRCGNKVKSGGNVRVIIINKHFYCQGSHGKTVLLIASYMASAILIVLGWIFFLRMASTLKHLSIFPLEKLCIHSMIEFGSRQPSALTFFATACYK